MEERLKIGQIVNTTGLKGFVKVVAFTDDITRFEDLDEVYLCNKNHYKKYKIEDIMYVKNMVALKFKNINTIEEAETLRNFYVEIDRKDAIELTENSYFIVDLIGVEVYNIENNELLGKIEDVYQNKSNDVYVVKDELGKQILLPAIKSVIKNVDIEKKRIDVELIKGLI